MNTKPDDVMLALWLDDELAGDEFTAVDSWAATQPEQLAAREQVREWRQQFSAVIPREQEPPYADFFNSRIQAAISAPRETAVAQPEQALQTAKASWWRVWFMPVTAMAGMALAFWVGTRTAGSPALQASVKEDDARMVYTPDSEVQAEYYTGGRGASAVIVLDGVAAIPDTLDFRETAWTNPGGDAESTAASLEGKSDTYTR